MVNTLLLKSIMVAKGHTNRSLSAAIGLSQNAFSAKINNKARTYIDEAEEICDALGIVDPRLKLEIFFV